MQIVIIEDHRLLAKMLAGVVQSRCNREATVNTYYEATFGDGLPPCISVNGHIDRNDVLAVMDIALRRGGNEAHDTSGLRYLEALKKNEASRWFIRRVIVYSAFVIQEKTALSQLGLTKGCIVAKALGVSALHTAIDTLLHHG